MQISAGSTTAARELVRNRQGAWQFARRPLNAVRTWHDRIARHEPEFARDLAEVLERIVEVAGRIPPATRAWIEHRSHVPFVLETAGGAGDNRSERPVP